MAGDSEENDDLRSPQEEDDIEHGIREEDDLIFNFFFVLAPLFSFFLFPPLLYRLYIICYIINLMFYIDSNVFFISPFYFF